MGQDKTPQQKKRLNPKDLWRIALLILGAIAVVQQLRKPAEERTWQGTVAGFMPYDFRRPTAERLRDAYWNPDGPIITNKAIGLGWTLNLGAVKKRMIG